MTIRLAGMPAAISVCINPLIYAAVRLMPSSSSFIRGVKPCKSNHAGITWPDIISDIKTGDELRYEMGMMQKNKDGTIITGEGDQRKQ